MLRNLIVKAQCDTDVDQWQFGASPVVSVSCKTRLPQLIQSLLQQPLQHGTVVAVFLYVLLLSLILIPQKSAYYLTFPLDT